MARATSPRRCLALAKTFDCGYVLNQKCPDDQLARAASNEGVPTVAPEFGNRVEHEDCLFRVNAFGSVKAEVTADTRGMF